LQAIRPLEGHGAQRRTSGSSIQLAVIPSCFLAGCDPPQILPRAANVRVGIDGTHAICPSAGVRTFIHLKENKGEANPAPEFIEAMIGAQLVQTLVGVQVKRPTGVIHTLSWLGRKSCLDLCPKIHIEEPVIPRTERQKPIERFWEGGVRTNEPWMSPHRLPD
jgi:hypothetical protein